MSKIEKVIIEGFWGDKEVNLNFKEDVNFLVGVNGSGKTTIINLIAATLKADFATLDRINFRRIQIDLRPQALDSSKRTAYIQVEKSPRQNSPYPSIAFSVKPFDANKVKHFKLNELEEEYLYRHHKYYDYSSNRYFMMPNNLQHDINMVLSGLVNVSWLTIHRTSPIPRKDERSYESTIDLKIEEIQSEFIKYFATLSTKYTNETELFQKFIFESLLDINSDIKYVFENQIEIAKEKDVLSQVFQLFGLNTKAFGKLEKYYDKFGDILNNIHKEEHKIKFEEYFFLANNAKIQGVVKRWQQLIEKKNNIYKSMDIFLEVINRLLERKDLFINEKNELTVRTQSGKVFPLTTLSSGEKQLLIILGQALLEDEKEHIYIADEPELSLHVAWQEKLVTSLKNINPNSQILFATHSPDIVGSYQSSVIKVEGAIK